MPTITECINDSNSSLRAVGENFLTAVKCSGIASADFSGVFEIKEDLNLSSALSEYLKEKARIQQEIAGINVSISNTQASIDSLNSKIRACDSTSYFSQIRSASSEVEEYRTAANRATNSKAKEEAQSRCSAAQRKKEQVEAASRANTRNRNEYASQKNYAENTLSDYNGQKKNFNNRLSQVEEIISLF